MSRQPKLADDYPIGSEERAVAAVMDLYDEGMRNGDPSPLRQAFHPTAYMHGLLDETDLPETELCWPIERFFQRAGTYGRGWDREDKFRSTITTMVVSGAAATVVLRETSGRGGRNYDDFFTLFRTSSGWKIASKVFMQLPRTLQGP